MFVFLLLVWDCELPLPSAPEQDLVDRAVAVTHDVGVRRLGKGA